MRDAVDPGIVPGIGRREYPAGAVMNLCADIRTLTEDTGFVPEYSFEEGFGDGRVVKENIIMQKKISVVIPTYNEEENVGPLSKAIMDILEQQLSEYDYEIIFIDNHSKDTTRVKLRKICEENKRVKAIFNARNFGQMRSPVHGLKQATGDCVIRMCGFSGSGEHDRGFRACLGRRTQDRDRSEEVEQGKEADVLDPFLLL